MATIYGIDTGSWRVRIAAMEGTFGRFEIRDAAQVAVEDGPATADHGHDRAVLDGIRALKAEEPGWESAEKVAAFPLGSGVVRNVRLPFTDRNAIARAIPAEVESQVPWDLEEMVLGTRVINAKDGGSQTAVFIARRDALRALLDGLESAGAEPRVMCMDADALSSYADRGVQVVLDVGHRRSVLVLCQNGQLLAARLISSGGAAVTRAIAEATGLSLLDAELQKHEMELPARSGEVVLQWAREGGGTEAERVAGAEASRALSDAVDEWCAEVRAELIVLEDELKVGIDELLLCGGGARLGGLHDRLAAQTGVAARSVVVPGGHAPEYALAVALARCGAGEVKAVDLRTGDFAYHGHAETMVRAIGLMTLGGAVAMFAALTLFTVQYMDARRRLGELDARIAEVVTTAFPSVAEDRLGEPSMALAIMQELTTESTTRVAVLGSTITGIPPTLDMLKALSESVPPVGEARIDVRELNITEAAVSFKAETDSYESAAKIEESLQKSARFKDARKADEKKAGEALTFTVNIPLGGEDAPADGEEG